MLNAANEIAVHAFLAGELPFVGIAEVIERTLEALPAAAGAATSPTSTRPTPRRATVARGVARMSWFLAFVGFALLIILHELGHFTAAKAVGMRVERFSLFFPPLLRARRRSARPSTRSARSRSAAT